MKKFIETIKNIFKIEELRKRLVYTFLLILVYRFGCFVVLPGIVCPRKCHGIMNSILPRC